MSIYNSTASFAGSIKFLRPVPIWVTKQASRHSPLLVAETVAMPVGFKVSKSSVLSGKKRKTTHQHDIGPNRLISVSSVSPALRKSALIAGAPLSLISGPGGRKLLLQRGKPDSSRHDEGCDLNAMELDGEFTDSFCRSSPTQRNEESPEEKRRRIREQRQQGRVRLAKRWKDDVLPRILPQYFLFHVHRPYAGRTFDEPPVVRTQCNCTKSSVMRIIVVQWNGEFILQQSPQN
jgi:hypothetical protein